MEQTDKEKVLQRLNNMDNILNDLKKVVKEYFKEPEKTVEAGDGFYLLKKGDMIQEGDECLNPTGWETTKNAGDKVLALNYRRRIPVPEGWERVIEGKVEKGDKIWNFSRNEYHTENQVYHLIDMEATVNSASFVIRPIKKPWNPEWWKEGKIVLNSRGIINDWSKEDPIAHDILPDFVNQGRVFQTVIQAEKYSAWEVKNAGRLRALQILEDRIKELNEGWELDFTNADWKYRFYTYFGGVQIERSEMKAVTSTSLYFKYRETGEQLISEFGEDFIKQALGF